MNLADRLLAIHESLDAHGVGHAFGGAIALAYWTVDPRGTSDIDVNLFTPSEGCRTALEALPEGIVHDEAVAETLEVDAVREHLMAMVGTSDARLARLAEAVRRADSQQD